MTDEQRAERLRYHMYDTNEGIREHAERIVALEELVAQYHSAMRCYLETGLWLTDPKCLEATMRELGVEVDE